MILYHGSYTVVKHPDITFSRETLDFGKGFYTTPIYDQAKKWSIRFKRRKGKSIVSYYEFNEIELRKEAKVKEFVTYSEEWLNYILDCRKGVNEEKYDVVIGGVANDRVFDTIELFFDGLIDKNTAIERLKYEKSNQQICFCSQKMIDKYLKYQKYDEVI
jgi:hypothetical protein